MKPARLVEVATSGAVVTRYGATSGLRASSTRTRPNASWVEIGLPDPQIGALRDGDAQGGGARRPGQVLAPARWPRCPAGDAGSRRSHSVSRSSPSEPAASSICVDAQQRRVVARVAGDRQPPALDGVGEDHARPVVDAASHCRSASSTPARSWPPRSVTSAASSSSGPVADEAVDLGSGRRPGTACAARPGSGRTATGTARWASASIHWRSASPPGWSNAACSRRPYFTSTTCQPAASNCPRHWSIRTPGTTRSRDWRLKSTIQVTLPRPGGGRVGDGLPDVALVELGVADQRDEAAAGPGAEVGVDVAAGGGGEQRRGRAQADRAGGEVDLVGVLGAGRVGLQAAAGAQLRQVGAVEVAEQVLDRVEDRRGVRLDRDPVRPVEVGEVQRGHRGDQRGAGRLVAADLDPVAGVAVVVGGVDDPGRRATARGAGSRGGPARIPQPRPIRLSSAAGQGHPVRLAAGPTMAQATGPLPVGGARPASLCAS